MGRAKCIRCGLVNFVADTVCRRCGQSLADADKGVTDQLRPGPQPAENVRHNFSGAPPQSAPYAALPGVATEVAPYISPYAPPNKPRDGMALSSLIIGGVGFFSCGLLWVGSVVGLALGIVAMVKASRYPTRYGGHSMALAGTLLNGFFAVLTPIIAAIVIPGLMKARAAANETFAIDHLRDIAAAEATYRSTHGGGNKFGTLDELIAAGLLGYDGRKKNGYKFEVRLKPYNCSSRRGSSVCYRFEAVATPLDYASSGYKSFYMSDDYVIHAADKMGREASADDPSIGGQPYKEKYDDPWSTY